MRCGGSTRKTEGATHQPSDEPAAATVWTGLPTRHRLFFVLVQDTVITYCGLPYQPGAAGERQLARR